MLELELNIKPYSVNKYFYGNRSIKRRETVEWELDVIYLLKKEEIQKNIELFRNSFCNKKNSIRVYLEFVYPKQILFTKDNKLSSKAFDLSNVEKPIIDVLFLEKYCTSVVKNIQIDDKYITEIVSKKSSGDIHQIKFKAEIIDLQCLLDK